jgi:hypothetical protein
MYRIDIPVFDLEDALPTNIAGLTLERIDYYPDPRLGVQIRYGTATTAKADAYLYDLGLSDIPNDLRSSQLVAWFREACQGVTMAAERGLYRDLETLTSQYLHLPPDAPEPFCLWASFLYSQAPGPDVIFPGQRVSNIALRTDRGYINKVRYTFPEDAREKGYAGFLAFLVEWTGLVQQAPPESQSKDEPSPAPDSGT